MLPSVNSNIKSYVYFFLQKFSNKNTPYSVEHIKKNKLLVHVSPNEYNLFKRFDIIMSFDDKDNIRTVIDTDDQSFYTSLFYIEVIRKKRDNEAWKIIKTRYNDNEVIEKFIYFLLNAPKHIIDLIE